MKIYTSIICCVAITTFLLIESGEAIKCYDNAGGTDTCSGDSVCYSAVHQMYTEHRYLYYKGCVLKEQCNSYKICGAEPTDTNCQLECCDTDRCNSSLNMASMTLFTIVAAFLATVLNMS